jgi:outer membrane protein assembly factor BamB
VSHRMRLASLLLFALIGGLAGRSVARAEDWPQFRGPTGQGIATATNLPVEWSEDKNITWKTPIPGRGWSSPVVLGNQIWMTTATDDAHSLRAVCVDRGSGRVLHDVEVFHVESPVHVNAKNSHASPSPCIEPGRVYVNFGTMGTACLATDTAKILWTNDDLKLDHSQGPGSSPVLYRNTLICTCDGMDVQYIIALDKNTGQKVWKTDRSGKPHSSPDHRKAFATPLIVPIDGQEELISVAANQVLAYDPASGSELWKVRFDGFSNVARPVYGAGLLFISTGYEKASLWGIRPEGTGDISATNVAWKNTKDAPRDPSPVFTGGLLYIVSDAGVATCLDPASGKEIWRHRLGGGFSASPMVAQGRIYFFSETGDTMVVNAGQTYDELAVNHLDGCIMATPAFVDHAILLRTESSLYRIEKR